eukprot:TRINITY_DN67988_c0_g1_i1.p1 TRINITY_DN67988_c0_g1~~TRINITY_DN67988_c0_g1_i1.p1  ORF type:complete len:509 (+),score=99.45 TRINITY_DN67988_c0_g1_i1:170-1696(+)
MLHQTSGVCLSGSDDLVITMTDACERFEGLSENETSSERIRIRGLRATHRQRFRRTLHFVGLRDAAGCKMEGVFRAEVLQLPAVTECYHLGDVVAVVARVEKKRERLALLVEKVEVEEAWHDQFSGAVFAFDLGSPGVATLSDHVFLQMAATHFERLCEHMESELGISSADAFMVRPVWTRKHRECGLVVKTAAAEAIVENLRNKSILERVIQRFYKLEGGCTTFVDAVEALASRLHGEQTAGERARIRVSAFPRCLEMTVAKKLDERGLRLELHDHDLLACVVYLCGGYAIGVARRSELGGVFWRERKLAETHGEQAGDEVPTNAGVTDDDVSPVCRAYYKIREVASREKFLWGAGSLAIDCGASPGGWSTFLAASGCSRVIAIDPGAIDLVNESEAVRGAIDHMQMKLQDALPLLLERGEQAELYCCDMNDDPKIVVDLLMEALPLLMPGARLVLTFKNVFSKKEEWLEAQQTQIARLQSTFANIRSVHLFANTPRECTVLGNVAS